MFISTKSYFNYSCAHRQWKDNSHCSYIHGYDRSFHFKFIAKELTDTSFVMHFGHLKEWKAMLDQWFDHTLLLNEDDPLLPDFRALEAKGAAKIHTLPNVGMEGTSAWLHTKINEWLKEKEFGRVACLEVETREHEKNSAIFHGMPDWFEAGEIC